MWRPERLAAWRPHFYLTFSDMTCGEPIYMNAAELTLLADNPRTIGKTDFERLVDSIKTNGFWRHRPLAVTEQRRASRPITSMWKITDLTTYGKTR